MTYDSPDFWISLMQIIGVNIVLSGDNAVVIALAARGLPAHQQRRAVAWGSGAAVVMRIALTIVAVELLRLPYLKLIGAGLLLWIAVQLLLPEHEGDGHGAATSGMAAAIKTILLADLVMSLDNVIAVAAAAKGSTLLLVIGLAISIPLVVFASQLLLVLMGRFPVIITIGAALLGWVAGDMAVSDPIVKTWVDGQAAYLHWLAPLAGAIAVVLIGRWLAARKSAAGAAVAAGRPRAAVVATPAGLQRVLVAVDGTLRVPSRCPARPPPGAARSGNGPRTPAPCFISDCFAFSLLYSLSYFAPSLLCMKYEVMNEHIRTRKTLDIVATGTDRQPNGHGTLAAKFG